jgi:3-hydroxybutyrate dehydrogenase
MHKRTLKVLITGGSRGLGRQMAEYLCKQNHEVYIYGKSKTTEIDPSLYSILAGYTECDLSNRQEIETCLDALINQIGRIDVLINNAFVKQPKLLGDFLSAEIQHNIDVDFLAPVILSNLCLPIMKRNNFGRIINISSISAYKVYSTGTLYCSGNRALIAFSEALSKELSNLGGAVTVNVICPDSFSKIDGTILKNHRQITNSVLVNINRIIQTGLNGKVINVFTFKHRLRESFRYIKLAITMLIP